MVETTLKAKIVHVHYRAGKTGLFFATSPDLQGLLVAEKSYAALDSAVPGAIVDLYKACGVDVVVTPVEDGDSDKSRSWVAVPAEIARKALESARIS